MHLNRKSYFAFLFKICVKCLIIIINGYRDIKNGNGRLGWALHCGIQFYKLNWKYNILAFLSVCVSQNGIMHSKKKKKRKKR